MLTIKILGPGCGNCKKLEAVTSEATSELGLEVEFVKVSDYAEILVYDVLSTPALVINEKLVCAGRIPTRAEVKAWLAENAEK